MASPPGQPPLAQHLLRMTRRTSLLLAGLSLIAVLINLAGSAQISFLPTAGGALLTGLCGLAVASAVTGSDRRASLLLAAVAAAAVGALLLYLLVGLPSPERRQMLISPATAGVLLVEVFAIHVIRLNGPWPLAGQGAALVGLALGLLTLNGKLQGETTLGALGARFPMTGGAAALVVALSLLALAARPDRGVTAALIDTGPAGSATRRLLVPLALGPILINLALGYGVALGWYDPQTQEALFTLLVIVLVLALMVWQISKLSHSEHVRRFLEASNDRARMEMGQLVDAVTDYAIYSLDPDGRVSSWNPGAERIKGYTAEEAIGADEELCLPAGVRNRGLHARMLVEAREKGRAVYEGWLEKKDGTRFYAHTTITPVNNDDGELIGYAKVTRDLTIEKLAETEHAKLQTLLATVGDAIIVVDERGRIESFNRAAENMFGYGGSEVQGKEVTLLMPPVEQSCSPRIRRRYMETGDPRVFARGENSLARHRDGTLFPIEVSISQMLVSGERKYVGVVRDVTERKRAEEALRDSEARLALAVEAGQLGVWDMDVESGRVTASGPLARMLENLRPAVSAVDTMREWLDSIHPDDRDRAACELDALVEGRVESCELEFRMQGGDHETWRWLFVRARAQQRDGRGRAIRVVGVTLDIDQRKRTEEALRKHKIDLDMALKGSAFHLWHYHVREKRVAHLDRLIESLGYERTPETASTAFWRTVIHPRDLARLDCAPWRSLPEELRGTNGMELRLRCRDGSWRWMITRARVIERSRDGEALVIAGTCHDITERKKAEEKLLHAAQHDPLTGLPNRALTYAFGEHILDTSTRHGGMCAVLFVDLDRFKPINDTYGHAAGDAVLVEVGERLRQCVRSDDVVGRLGGDEFLVVLAPLPGPEEVARIAMDCIAHIRRPYWHRSVELVVSPSIGISLYPNDGRDMQTLVKHADTAMYHAKESGRNNFQFFTPAMNARATSLLRMESQMRRSIDREGFEVYYQPVVDTDSNRMTSVEALLRWPESGFTPDEFIPVAESSGLIIPLGEWMLREACLQQRRWSESGLGELRMSVNISSVQFRQQRFVAMVAGTLARCGVHPKDLQLEITESAILRNVEEVIGMLRALRQHGHRVALDDFGKGYSSLNYLRTLPLDAVKVDKDFVHELSSDPVNLAITEAIIQLGLSLGLQVIAEGIESREVLELLKARQCRHMQGYYIGEPRPAIEFEAWFMRTGGYVTGIGEAARQSASRH